MRVTVARVGSAHARTLPGDGRLKRSVQCFERVTEGTSGIPHQTIDSSFSQNISQLLEIEKKMSSNHGQDLSGSRGLPDWGPASEHLTGVRSTLSPGSARVP